MPLEHIRLRLGHFVALSQAMARRSAQGDVVHRSSASTTSMVWLKAPLRASQNASLDVVAARLRCPASQRDQLLANVAFWLAK